jgi:hypothetical protein
VIAATGRSRMVDTVAPERITRSSSTSSIKGSANPEFPTTPLGYRGC